MEYAMNETTTPTTREPASVGKTTKVEIPARNTERQHDHEHRPRSEARERLSDAGQRAKSEAQRAADGVRRRTAKEVRTLGAAAHAAAEQLKDDDHDRIGGYARGICSACDGAADYLERADLSTVGDDAGRFARHNPALFLGGAVLLGLAAGRLLSASPPRPRHEEELGERTGRPIDRAPSPFSETTTREPRARETTQGHVPVSAAPTHTPSRTSNRSSEGMNR
jgi:hypothetical protein